MEHAARIDREILVRPAPQPSLLGTGLNLLAGAALGYRRVLGSELPAWTLIGWFARGHLLAPPLRS